MKKGRHRRYEEARALKRGPDLDIGALFTDLEGEPVRVATAVSDDSETGNEDDYYDDDSNESRYDDEA